MAELTAKFEKATGDKLKCQQEAEATNNTITLANRLVGGLASENVRWGEAVAAFKEAEKTLRKLDTYSGIDRSIRLHPWCTCEQEHVSPSNAFLHNSATRTKHTRTDVGP